MRRRVFVTLALLLVPALASAGWMELVQSDARGRLTEAREQALRLVESAPDSPTAVAAAAWWLNRTEVLKEPEALLDEAPQKGSPELGFVLGSLRGRLRHEPPPGVVGTAELAGPFGGFDLIDLDRRVWPSDKDLPAPGTRWDADWKPFRLRFSSRDGWIGPPRPLLRTGVYLACWSLSTPSPVDGWLVIELDANADIELDGKVLSRVRPLENLSAEVIWYRVHLQAGVHRLRVAMASTVVPRARARWLDVEGRALPLKEGPPSLTGGWAASRAERSLPPVEAALRAALAARPSLEERLLAAALASVREAPLDERRQLEASVAAAPDVPWGHLALAGFFLTEPTGSDNSVDYRRCREELGKVEDLPGALVIERELDLRQKREEDAETILDRLLEKAPSDPRVQMLALQRAIKRGWTREIEEGLGSLASSLAGSSTLVDLELDAMKATDQLDRYTTRLRALATTDPLHDGLLDRLLDTSSYRAALTVIDALRASGEDPTLDMERIRLLLSSGQLEAAQAAHQEAEDRWGPLFPLDQLGLQLALESGGKTQALRTLERALEHAPSSIDLRLLERRWGAHPFWEPWRTDGLDLVREARAKGGGEADAVLVLDQAVERVFPDGSSLHYYHGMTLAFTPEGAKQASVLNILPGAELLQVRILKEDGSVEIPADLGSSSGSGLEHVEPGDVVEQEYVAAIDRATGLGRGHMSPYIYRFADSDRAFGLSEYVLLYPPDLKISIDGNLEGVTREQRTVDGLTASSFRVTEVPPVPMEPFSPPSQELLPWVTYGFGVAWTDVGDIVRDRVLRLLRGSPELDQWARPLLSADGSPKDRIRKLVASLIDTVEAGKALLDPNSTAGKAFSLKRGNRLGVLLGVLRGAGWSTDLVLTRPLVYAGTHLAVPSMEVFGIPLVRVQRDGETVWIDLAEENAGVDHIRPQFQGSDGLLIPISDATKASSYLKSLPHFQNPDEAERVSLAGTVTKNGDADVEVRLSLRGTQARRLIEAVRSLPEDRVGMLYEQVASGLFRGASQVKGTILDPEEHPVLSLSLHLDGACEPSDGSLDCRQLTLPAPLSPTLASLPERRYPLVLQLPLIRIHELELRMPDGFSADPTPRHFQAEWGSVTERRSVEGRTLRSRLELNLPAQKIAPERYPDFARFCHAIDELLTRPVRLVRSP